MTNTPERSQSFLNFLENVRNERRILTKSAAREFEAQDTAISSPASSEERRLTKKLNDMTKVVATLEKSLTDRQEAVKAKHATKPVDIEWSLSDEVSSELKITLNCFDRAEMERDVIKFATSLNSYVSAESQLSHQLQHNSSIINTARKRSCDVDAIGAQDESEYTLLEAEASVRLLHYKKHVASQVVNVLKEVCSREHDREVINTTPGDDKKRDIEKMQQYEVEIEGLRCKLQQVVEKRLSCEKDVMKSRKQRDLIVNLQEVVASQRAILGDLDQQRVRYEATLLSIEKDRTTVNNLRRRCDMINKLLKNDADSTTKMRDTHQFESKGDYCPSHLANTHTLDQRDKLMNCVKNVLMRGAAHSGENLTVDDLTQHAGNIKSYCDENIAKLANVVLAVQDTVRRTESTFAELIDTSKGLDEASNNAAIHDQFQIHQQRKREVTSLLKNLKIKIDSRNGHNGHNGVDELMKLDIAESERCLIDLYLLLQDESDIVRARELEKQIIGMLSTPLVQRRQENCP
mmetsp:Transcript_8264/g.15583  ORF Transcript_8264/g.15583 Transcript_8264/m.15583 type:complete len:519 (-) Transcript_8264:61-1617(-)